MRHRNQRALGKTETKKEEKINKNQIHAPNTESRTITNHHKGGNRKRCTEVFRKTNAHATNHWEGHRVD
jgi:hypothetical protein